ncbi:MAG: hypothetical protein HYU68_13615 [Bacteroidetes bacterium]|nr:hypothetical protein [Bacteroidota bacterium]
MELTILTILLGLLAVVVFQDFKSRSISWFLIPLLFVAFIGSAILKIDVQEFILYSGINLSIIVMNLLGVTLFVWLKEKKLKNIVDTYLGLGDILFFLVLTTVFSPLNFIVFYLGSIMLITIIYGYIILFNKQKNTLIPLAGAMSVLLMMVLVADVLIPTFNVYQDIILLNE